MDLTRFIQLVENGKQLGADIWKERDAEMIYESAGIQKWNGRYRVGVTIIAESDMAAEDFEVDEVSEFNTVEEAIEYLKKQSSVPVESMDVCKGQKIFSPEALYSERGDSN
jgi:hypothetical protein